MSEWIVIIAVSTGSSMGLSVPATITPTLYSTPAIYNAPPSPPPPTITVIRAKTREEAETQARGYYLRGSAMWVDDKLVSPDLGWSGSSRAVVIIAPDGKVYRVESVEKKKRVVREVEESDGWEMKWTEQP